MHVCASNDEVCAGGNVQVNVGAYLRARALVFVHQEKLSIYIHTHTHTKASLNMCIMTIKFSPFQTGRVLDTNRCMSIASVSKHASSKHGYSTHLPRGLGVLVELRIG